MDMKKYIGKRVFWGIVALFGLSIFIFYLARILPGDPVLMMVDPRTPQPVIDQLRRDLALNKPIYLQYFYWLRDVISGNFGYSFYSRHSLTIDIGRYLPQSLELITLAGIIQIGGAFLIGISAGSNINEWQDHIARSFAYIGCSIPAFVWAIFLQLIFAYWLGVLPTSGALSEGYIEPSGPTGFISIDSLLHGEIGTFVNFLQHLILPAFALAILGMAQAARILRTGMNRIKEKDYISMAHAYGFPIRTIRYKYLLRPSVIPAVTVMGMQIAIMLGNAFLVEMVFRYPGFSKFAINAMLQNDLNTIVATVLIIGFLFFVINLVVDIIVAYIDPRIRYGEKE